MALNHNFYIFFLFLCCQPDCQIVNSQNIKECFYCEVIFGGFLIELNKSVKNNK